MKSREENILIKLVGMLPVPAVAVDPTGEILFMNHQAGPIFGYRPEETIGKRLTRIFPGTGILEVFASGQGVKCRENTPFCPVFIANYEPVYLEGCLAGVLAVFQPLEWGEDLSAARLLTNLYEAILADVVVGVAVTDAQGQVVFINKVYCDLLDLKAEEVLGQPADLVLPHSRLPKVMSTGTPWTGQVTGAGKGRLLLSEMAITSGGQVLGGLSKVLPQESLQDDELVKRYRAVEDKLVLYQNELAQLRQEQSPFQRIVGFSGQMMRIKRLAEKVAKGDATILLHGESGTGKEVFAQAIHQGSPRCKEPFIKINCAAIPDKLLEAELFGYEEGAFTGAAKGGKPGKFELANGGTIFLDEIGDMPLNMQAKLLRVLQDRCFERVGGTRTLQVDVRIIAATNRNLEELIQRGEFRLDLYYRFSVITMEIPPLRERREDIPLLANHIMEKLSQRYGVEVEGLTPEVHHCFTNHSWPGNVRQLENVLEHAFNLLEEGEKFIGIFHLPERFVKEVGNNIDRPSATLEEIMAEAEKKAILQALAATGGNRMEAANLLGIHRSGFYQKLKKYGITGEEGNNGK